MKYTSFSVRSLTLIPMLGALSAVLMLLAMPLSFAPASMNFDVSDLPALFAIARPRIEAAARAKLSARSSPPLGVLHIWEEDILDPSPGASPRAMEASMRRG